MIEVERDRRIRLRRLAQRIRVPSGFILAPLLLVAARPSRGSLVAGGVVALLGLAIRAWASGCLRKNERLTTFGPYAHTRNPLYLGTFVMVTGIAVAANVAWLGVLFAGLYLLIYVPVMYAEAETMSDFFPAEYEDYRKSVPLFLPRLTPYRRGAEMGGEPRAGGFDIGLYLRHREYRAALGVIAVLAILAARLYWRG